MAPNTYCMYILINMRAVLRVGKPNFVVLRVYTYVNAFIGCILSFYQCKNRAKFVHIQPVTDSKS